MIRWILKHFEKAQPALPTRNERRKFFSTDYIPEDRTPEKLEAAMSRNFKKAITPEVRAAMDAAEAASPGFAMDAGIKSNWANDGVIPQGQLLWYANQSFIGYQLCAVLSQQWLVGKACLMPAQDAVRKGYTITVNDGTELPEGVIEDMRAFDRKYNLKTNLIQFANFGRVFGIRIAMFKVDSDDPQYYYKPFNPDGVKPGSYRGIAQIDPYWVSPQLDAAAAGDPSSVHFYDPTWWNISGSLVHRTHLVIYRTEEVPDVLKPAYVYGGIPIPQKIMERVYSAERTANEAPMLALTKRTDVISTDLQAALADQPRFTQRMADFVFRRDNFGVKIIDTEDEMQQFDTTLSDFDEVIMSQYQLVAAASNVPAVKLLGTSPKGFNATGEYEEASYHEMLESLQEQALTPLVDRHHQLLILSEIMPKYGISVFSTEIVWKPLDAMTAKEQAELNKLKADAGAVLVQSGAIDGMDERKRLIDDPESGYSGIAGEEDDDPLNEIINEAPVEE